jgi:hypothetical protein
VIPTVEPTVIQFDTGAGRIYWHDQAYGGFRRANLDGTTVENVLQVGATYSADIDVVNGDFYWTTFDSLWRAPIDGTAPPAVIATDPAFMLPGSGKQLDVVPELDVVVWIVSGGRMHWTRISSPGAIETAPGDPTTNAHGSLEVLPGPRPHFVFDPTVVPSGAVTTLDIGGVEPLGNYGMFLSGFNGIPLAPTPLFFGTVDADGRAVLPIPLPLPPMALGLGMVANDVVNSNIVFALESTLTIL